MHTDVRAGEEDFSAALNAFYVAIGRRPDRLRLTLDLFTADIPGKLADMDLGLAASDAEKCKTTLHSITNYISVLRTTGLGEECRAAERAAVEGDLVECRRIFVPLRKRLISLVQTAHRFLREHPDLV